jgi:hypothetical protein
MTRGLLEIAGNSTDDVWFAYFSELYHFDGTDWVNVASEGTRIHDIMEEKKVGFSSLIVDEAGTVIVSTRQTLYRVEEDTEGWSFRAMKEPPCEGIDEIFRATTGDIYAGGEDHCWARLESGEWTVFSPRSTSDVIPDGRRAFFERTRQFIPQPESDGPLVIAGAGVFSLRDDGTYEKEVLGAFVDGVHMPVTGRTILVHEQGLMARFD